MKQWKWVTLAKIKQKIWGANDLVSSVTHFNCVFWSRLTWRHLHLASSLLSNPHTLCQRHCIWHNDPWPTSFRSSITVSSESWSWWATSTAFPQFSAREEKTFRFKCYVQSVAGDVRQHRISTNCLYLSLSFWFFVVKAKKSRNQCNYVAWPQ